MKIFTIGVTHVHPDDGEVSDHRKHVVIAASLHEAKALLRPRYGEAWEFRVEKSREIAEGVVL